MSIMQYLQIIIAAATAAPQIVKDVRRFVEQFKDDKTVVAVVRTALEAVKAGVNDIEAILPPVATSGDNGNGEN